MKVLQILPALETGGVERGTVEIAKALTAAKIPNLVVSSGGRYVYDLKKMGVKHIELPVQSKNPFRMILTARRLRKVIRDEGVTIVHARSRAPAWVAKIALRKCPNVHFLTTFHGTYGLSGGFLKKAYNRVMLSGQLVISISNFITHHIVTNYGFDTSKIRLVYRGADVEKFNPAKVSSDRVYELAGQWQIPPDKPVILLPGRLTRWKGQLVLLEALSLMKNKAVTCLFVGSDQGRTDYYQQMKQAIDKLSPQTTVLMKDHCNDMPLVYMLSDIVVSASTDPEAFGRVIPEAQAMGRIVIGSDHGGATETIQDGKTGFLVPPSDARALAKKLDEVLQMSIMERKKMSADAIKSVRDYFSIEQMCRKTLAVYKELDNGSNVD